MAVSSYREEGWFYDITQVRGAAVMLVVALTSFAMFTLDYLHRWGSNDTACTPFGACGSGSSSISFLFALLTGVTSLAAVAVGSYTIATNTHRVRKLAWACTALSASSLLGLLAFLLALSF